MTDIYDTRIDSLPEHLQGHRSFALLCAIWTKQAQSAQLIHVERAVSLVRTRPDVLGIGSYLARYLIDTLALWDEATVRHAERLCAYVLARVKMYVSSCGGASQILTLSDSGEINVVPQFIISEDEATADLVMNRGAKWMFHWVDTVGWRGDLTKLDEVVDFAAKMVKTELRLHLARGGHQGEQNGGQALSVDDAKAELRQALQRPDESK